MPARELSRAGFVFLLKLWLTKVSPPEKMGGAHPTIMPNLFFGVGSKNKKRK
jgi:hypothetical protein